MIVCFVRHGKAEEKKPGQSDEERRLTEEGRRDVEIVAKALPVSQNVKILTSPLLRAKESAEIIAKVVGGRVEVAEELRPERASLEALATIKLESDTIFVGHAPSLERVVSEVIGGGNVKLKAGGAACIDIGDRDRLGKSIGVLVLLVQPAYVKRISS